MVKVGTGEKGGSEEEQRIRRIYEKQEDSREGKDPEKDMDMAMRWGGAG